MRSNHLKCFAILLMALLCMTSCSKDEEPKTLYFISRLYREANLPTISMVQKNGKSYRPVHFIVLELSSDKIYRYEVYNDDAVTYYGIKGLTSLPGYDGWYYDTNAVTALGFKMESKKLILEDGTVLEEVVSDGDQITAFKENGTIKYVGWKYDDKF